MTPDPTRKTHERAATPPPAVSHQVEVCWDDGADVACRTVDVLARCDEEAALRALALMEHEPTAEVVDVHRCPPAHRRRRAAP